MNETMVQIKEWMLAKSPDIKDFDEEYDIIENRVIDSLHFMELIYLIESLSGQEIDISGVTVADFSTLSKIHNNFFSKQ